MDRLKSTLKFVGLHAHSGFSTYDGMGLPGEHMDFSWNNGCDALALTDHGSMSGFAHQFDFQKKMKKIGKIFKPIFGIEAYIHPSISEWENLFLKSKTSLNEDENNGTVLELESETKTRHKNPLRERYHIVLLAMNQIGLKNLFTLTSKSFTKPYYYAGYPRIDLNLLKKHSDGVIMSTACLGGHLSGQYWQYIDDGIDVVKFQMSKILEQYVDIFGQQRCFGEIQWIRAKEQHIVNKCIIDVCKDMGIDVISTCDSHYPKPELWKDRELYRKLNPRFKSTNTTLPSSIDELGMELYPKNGDQLYNDYKKYSQQSGFEYSDKFIIDSIERTHHIAFNIIEDFSIDTKIKLPNFILKDGQDENEELRKICLKAFSERIVGSGKNEKKYLDQLERELDVFKDTKMSKYFLTMKQISDKSQDVGLVNHGRGSSSGSLVNYLLKITQIDPIEHNLSFSRFMLSPEPYGICVEKQKNEDYKFPNKIIDSCIEIEMINGEKIKLTENCKLFVKRNNDTVWITAKDLQENDEIIES